MRTALAILVFLPLLAIGQIEPELLLLSVASQAADTTIYVDSIAGDDSNPGTLAQPFLTLSNALAVASNQPTPFVALKRNSWFREGCGLPDNISLLAYGTGTNPVISGAVLLTNALFSLTDGCTSTYQYPITIPLETNPYANFKTNRVLKVWDDSRRLKGGYGVGQSTIIGTNLVDVQANTWWYDWTNGILYVHPFDDTSPIVNGRTYEASIRTLAVHGGTNVHVTNIIAEKCYNWNGSGQQGYQILGYKDGVYDNCLGRYGWNHCMGFANTTALSPGTLSLWVSCGAYDAEMQNDSAPTLWVFYKDTSPNSTNVVIATNCWAGMPYVYGSSNAPTNLYAYGQQIKGFYSHGASGTYDITAFWDNCATYNCYRGLESHTNAIVRYGARSSNDYIGIYEEPYVAGSREPWSSDTDVYYTNLLILKASYQGMSLGGSNVTYHISDAHWSYGGGAQLQLAANAVKGGVTCVVENCTWYSNGGNCISIYRTNARVTISNCALYHPGIMYQGASGTFIDPVIAYVNSNIYNAPTRYGNNIATNDDFYITWTSWTNSWNKTIERDTRTNVVISIPAWYTNFAIP